MRRRSQRLASGLGAALLLASVPSRASESIAIGRANDELRTLAERVAIELASAGFSVSFVDAQALPSCEQEHPESAKASDWVRLAPDPQDSERVLALLCLHGIAATTSGPRSDPARFAVTAAEALNGLRAKPVAPAPHEEPRPAPVAQLSKPEPPLARASLSVAESLVLDLRGFPTLWGTSLDAELPLGSHVYALLDGLVPISRAELSSSQAELRAGVGLLRLGVALHQSIGQLALSSSIAAGPALMWATAEAKPPRVGGSATALSGVASLGIQLWYPERGSLFALARARSTLLLPAGRFVVPDEPAATLGPLLFETSLGVGARL